MRTQQAVKELAYVPLEENSDKIMENMTTGDLKPINLGLQGEKLVPFIHAVFRTMDSEQVMNVYKLSDEAREELFNHYFNFHVLALVNTPDRLKGDARERMYKLVDYTRFNSTNERGRSHIMKKAIMSRLYILINRGIKRTFSDETETR